MFISKREKESLRLSIDLLSQVVHNISDRLVVMSNGLDTINKNVLNVVDELYKLSETIDTEKLINLKNAETVLARLVKVVDLLNDTIHEVILHEQESLGEISEGDET